jgi:hypothetical protein
MGLAIRSIRRRQCLQERGHRDHSGVPSSPPCTRALSVGKDDDNVGGHFIAAAVQRSRTTDNSQADAAEVMTAIRPREITQRLTSPAKPSVSFWTWRPAVLLLTLARPGMRLSSTPVKTVFYSELIRGIADSASGLRNARGTEKDVTAGVYPSCPRRSSALARSPRAFRGRARGCGVAQSARAHPVRRRARRRLAGGTTNRACERRLRDNSRDAHAHTRARRSYRGESRSPACYRRVLPKCRTRGLTARLTCVPFFAWLLHWQVT